MDLHNPPNQPNKEEEYLELQALSPNPLGPLEQPHPLTPLSLEHNLLLPRVQVHLEVLVKANPPREESSDSNSHNSSNNRPPQEYLEDPLSNNPNKEASSVLQVDLVRDKVLKAKEFLVKVLKDNNNHKVKEYSDNNKLVVKVNMVEQPQLLLPLNPNNKVILSEAIQPVKEQEYLEHPLKELRALALASSEQEQPTLNNHRVKEDSSEPLHPQPNQLNRPRVLPFSEEQAATLREVNHSIAQE